MKNNILNFYDKRGKVYFGNINNFDSVDAYIYLFCTTYSHNVPEGTLLTPELAPSFDLLLQKKAWLDKGVFEKCFEEFKYKYIEEMNRREDYVRAIEKIEEYIRAGKKVVLFDDCNLDKYCHLQILKDYLKNKGYRVENIRNYPSTYAYLQRW